MQRVPGSMPGPITWTLGAAASLGGSRYVIMGAHKIGGACLASESAHHTRARMSCISEGAIGDREGETWEPKTLLYCCKGWRKRGGSLPWEAVRIFPKVSQSICTGRKRLFQPCKTFSPLGLKETLTTVGSLKNTMKLSLSC